MRRVKRVNEERSNTNGHIPYRCVRKRPGILIPEGRYSTLDSLIYFNTTFQTLCKTYLQKRQVLLLQLALVTIPKINMKNK
jgi:hypothetical protein